MKKTIAILSLLISLSVVGQKKDTVKQDSVIVTMTQFTKEEFEAFVKSIKELDEKPSVINAILAPFYQRTQYFKVPAPKK
jgi:hypothetical protein